MKLLITVLLIFVLSPQVSALEIEAPQVPQSATAHMPENTYSFGDGLLELLKSVFKEVRPDLAEASRVCLGIICMHILVAVIRTMSASVSTTVSRLHGDCRDFNQQCKFHDPARIPNNPGSE